MTGKIFASLCAVLAALALASCSAQPQDTQNAPDSPADTAGISNPSQNGDDGGGAPGESTPADPADSAGDASNNQAETSASPDPSSGDNENLTEPEDPEDDGPEDEPEASSSPGDTQDNGESSIVQLARSLIGTPFAWGGETPGDGFDNSGFIYYVLNQNGVSCPRRTSGQASIGQQINDYADLKPGDLVFFNSDTESDTPQFGGIYVGGGKMIYSPREDTVVHEVDITQSWYKEAFVHGVSIGETR